MVGNLGRPSRRGVLATIGSGVVGTLAGCPYGSDDTTRETSTPASEWSREEVYRTSFESESLPEGIEDRSDRGATVGLSTGTARTGSQSLVLRSPAGSNTFARARTARTFTGAHRFAVDVRKLTDTVVDGGVALHLYDAEADTILRVFDGDYCGRCLVERDATGDRIDRTRFGPAGPTDGWETVALSLLPDGVVRARFGDRVQEYDPGRAWQDRPLRPTLLTNVWASARSETDRLPVVEAAFDDLRVESLS